MALIDVGLAVMTQRMATLEDHRIDTLDINLETRDGD
jgi:hypothetical protein